MLLSNSQEKSPISDRTFSPSPPSVTRLVLRGQLSAYLGVILLAQVDIAIRVATSPAEPAQTEASSAAPYRKIFASYSHLDAEIVRQFELYVQALGDTYLRDVRDLRSGEPWSDRLLELIDQADVFQLFWSHNAMRSPHVRREWEHALALNRTAFVRPTYWETPMPESREEGLPPDGLRALHFQRIGWTDGTPVGVPGAAVRTPPSSPDASAPDPRPSASPRRAPSDRIISRRRERLRAGIDEAQKAFERADFDAAIQACEQVLLLDPEDAAALQLVDAARLALDRRRAAVLLDQARQEWARHHPDAALDIVHEPLVLDPTAQEATQLLDELRDARRQLETEYRRHGEVDAAVERALTSAAAALERGDFRTATARVHEALALDPASERAATLLREVDQQAAEQERHRWNEAAAKEEARAREAQAREALAREARAREEALAREREEERRRRTAAAAKEEGRAREARAREVTLSREALPAGAPAVDEPAPRQPSPTKPLSSASRSTVAIALLLLIIVVVLLTLVLR